MSSDCTPILQTFQSTEVLSASTEAVEFMSSVGLEELNLCLFTESLETVSESGKELGSFTVTVQSAYYEQEGKEDEKCFLVDTCCHGAVDDVPYRTSTIAYISPQLETLEQHHHEYFKTEAQSLDIKIHMKRHDNKMVINKVITQGQQVLEETVSHDLSSLTGLISEASNLLVMRLLARKKNIENMDFLTFDADTKLCISTYRQLGCRNQVIGKTTVEVYGVERTIHSEDIPSTWQCYFLPDGHLVSRVQIGTDITMRITQMPILSEPEEEDPKPVFEKMALNFAEDAQLLSEFQDRKEELISDHETYLRHHPEIKILLGDFMQFLLLRKPDDITAFAADFFRPFSTAQESSSTFPIFKGHQYKS